MSRLTAVFTQLLTKELDQIHLFHGKLIKIEPCSIEGGIMELTIDEASTKKLLKEVMLELMHERQNLFYDIMLEVVEDIGLATAIQEGRQNDFVSEEEISTILAD